MTLQLKFDANQDFQLEAIHSIVDLFQGYPRRTTAFSLTTEAVPNFESGESFSPDWLQTNLLEVQNRNDPRGVFIPRSLFGVEFDEGMELKGVSEGSCKYPSYTVEMETGTGKTYVYLRSIYELRKKYGFGKFIIVVPSIAIFEGVIKNFEITKDHFKSLYDNEVVHLIAYDSSQINLLRTFALSTFTEVMVITIDAFNKANNNIYKHSDKLSGEKKPFEYIQDTRPILILDEPQNMSSEQSKMALRTLHPLFALRFSATHRESPNTIFRLTPFEAYRRRLVKKISVWGVTESENLNTPFLGLESISNQTPWSAKVSGQINENGKLRQGTITLKQGDDLFRLTHNKSHESGYKVVNIHAGEKYVEFDNGIKLHLNDPIGPSRPAIFREQIRQTIQHHLALQEELLDQGIKVLSLFFIDRVSNFIDPNGLIRVIFDEEFNKIKEEHPHFKAYAPQDVRRHYFAKKNTSAGELDIDLHLDDDDKTKAEKEAEKAAFKLIMCDKEDLLSLDQRVGFIFAHSALREGWDNPNVFQICTLNQTVSEMKKRQEIGRGLRLPVNQDGERIHDDDINVLTVIANQSYESYAQKLQVEYQDAGDAEAPPVGNAKAKDVKRNDAVFQSKEFNQFWDALLKSTRYDINIDTDRFIDECITRLDKTDYPTPIIVVEKADFIQVEYTITLEKVYHQTAHICVERLKSDKSMLKESNAYEINNDLCEKFHDENLRGYKITGVDPISEAVTFRNGITLDKSAPIHFQKHETKVPSQRITSEPQASYSVPNLLVRAEEVTHLTRPTINRIFKGLSAEKKTALFKNPEGFTAKFIEVIAETLASHVADQIEFSLDGSVMPEDLDEIFKPVKAFKPCGLIETNSKCLYNQIQTESDIEKHFLENRLKTDPKIVFYFKFPDSYRISFPKVIGDYIPDWGIARRDDSGQVTLQLVRETKGSTDMKSLRFPGEERKIKCARKHFISQGLDFRVITDTTADWWHKAPDQADLG